MQGGLSWDPVRGTSYMTRLSADMSNRSIYGYDIETPGYTGALPRQDDRYNTALRTATADSLALETKMHQPDTG